MQRLFCCSAAYNDIFKSCCGWEDRSQNSPSPPDWFRGPRLFDRQEVQAFPVRQSGCRNKSGMTIKGMSEKRSAGEAFRQCPCGPAIEAALQGVWPPRGERRAPLPVQLPRTLRALPVSSPAQSRAPVASARRKRLASAGTPRRPPRFEVPCKGHWRCRPVWSGSRTRDTQIISLLLYPSELSSGTESNRQAWT